MNRPIRGASGAPAYPADAAELAEVHSLAPAPALFKPREALHPEEEALSLPPPEQPDPKIALLCRALGAARTTDNPLWSGDPVPRLRALQKALLAHALTLPPPRRRVCLDALTVVEDAITLRLRWQQMRRSDIEAADAGPAAGQAARDEIEEESADATPQPA